MRLRLLGGVEHELVRVRDDTQCEELRRAGEATDEDVARLRRRAIGRALDHVSPSSNSSLST
jgi:hypothetical protein